MVRELSELGVILLMFSLGLEFSLRRVVKVAGTSGLAALAETSVMLGLGFMIGRALGWTQVESVFTGAMVAISSTTIVAKAFAERGVLGRVTEVVFGILVVEDLIAILLVAVLTAVAAGAELSAGGLAMTAVRLATFLVALIGIGILIVPRPEMTLVASMGICFAAALLALAFGYSVALGAFIAGSLVAESGEGAAIDTLIRPVRDLFLAIFFVSVGMLIDPRILVDHWGAVLILTVVVIVGKVLAVTAGAFLTGNGLRPSLQAGMSLAQIGEFSFIIAAVGTATGAIRPELYAVAIAVSAITTLTTPWLIRAADPMALIVDRKLPRSVQTFVALYGSWIERLRESAPLAGGRARVRRLVRLLVIDVVLLALVIIAAAAEMGRTTILLRQWLGASEQVAQLAVIAGSVVISIPLVVGLVRTSWLLALALAVRAMPATATGHVDFARAPRVALVTTLHIAILLAVVAPLLAVTQPFLRGAPTAAVLLLGTGIFAVGFLRAARDLHGHARAGAHVIVTALSNQMTTQAHSDELSRTMEHVSAALPGLGEPTLVVLPANSSAVGRTLSDLDLRGLTGATVLCITRRDGAERETLVPAGRERLCGGDVLAIAGPHDAVAAARVILLR
jgi:CPA2 family monovalent cation:H+ antiporter-2